MDSDQLDKDVMFAQLLSLGFDEWICREAVDCNGTVEAATEWVLNTLDQNSGISRSTTSRNPTLSLRRRSSPVPMLIDETSTTSSSIPQPTLISRHLQPTDESEYTRESKAKAAKAAEEAKKQKLLEREARRKALLAIKEDRENIKQRKKQSHQTKGIEDNMMDTSSSSASTSSQPETSSKPTQDTTLIRIRLSTGQTIRQTFSISTKMSDLFEWVTNESEPSKDFQLLSPFPKKVFGDDQIDVTLADAGLVPNASLNVVRLDIPSVVVSRQPMTPPIRPVIPNNTSPNVQPTLPPQIPMQPNNIPPNNQPQIPMQPNNIPPNNQPQIPVQPNNIPPNNQPQIPVQPNIIPPNIPPHGRPMLPPPQIPMQPNIIPGGLPQIPRNQALRQLLGHPPMQPFFGGGRRLTDEPIIPQQDSDDEEHVETEEEKRKRMADAIQARVNSEESNLEDNVVKHGIKREVESLKSKCAYRVAVLLTSAASVRTVDSLANVSSNVGELLMAELIKLDKLDALTFRRFANCNLQNIILDNYPRASDSLLEVIGSTQRASVTRVSLRGCEVLTDTGLRGLQGLRYLESLDVSSCRIRDRALPFIQGFENLIDLNLSKTKVTIAGLRELFAVCAFAKNLKVLDLSYCNGISGRTVFADLQHLESIRSLNLCSVQLTPPQLPVNPSSFQHLEYLNVSRTKLCDQDVMILCGFKNLIDLNLTETTGVGQFGLKWMAREYKSLNVINFPNREEELNDILQDFSGLPLEKLDLENFVNVSDIGVMHIHATKSLTFLSLSGTKLTDAGMTALKGLENLIELYLDRTNITDNGLANLQDLRGLTHLSLNTTKIRNGSLRIIGKSAFSVRGLKYLNVGNTRVSDKGVKELKGLVKLTFLNLDFTRVSLSCKQILVEMPLLQPVRLSGITKEYCDENES